MSTKRGGSKSKSGSGSGSKNIPPVGLYLDSSERYQISTALGHGACGSVHAIVKKRKKRSSSSSTSHGRADDDDDGDVIPYVVKVAPVPLTTTTTSKKKKRTMAEKNADLLNFENILYRNVLNELRGDMIPDVPIAGTTNLPGYGDIDGYRFLVMERMDASFASLVPVLYHQQVHRKGGSRSSLCIPIGQIASRLLSLMEAMHETQHVFVDVKPDNFMIRHNQIRMIDMGLVESYRDVMRNKHRMNQFPNGQVVGTPTYLSLNVLNGHTISRRDDLEAVGYVLLELILQLKAFGDDGGTRGNDDGDDDDGVKKNLLPWSNARSDEEIRIQKDRAVQGTDGGIFWNDMIGDGGDKDKLRNGMKEYMRVVGSLQFKERPDYDELRRMVMTLKVKVPYGSGGKSTSTSAASTKRRKTGRDNKATAATATTKPTNTRGGGRRHDDENEHSSDDSEVLVPSKPSARAARAAARNVAKSSNEDVEMIDVGDSRGASQSSAEMDWELLGVDENESSISNSVASKKNRKAVKSDRSRNHDDDGAANKEEEELVPSLRLECTEGPHKGEEVILTDTLILGQCPKQRGRGGSGNNILHVLHNDEEASASHAKLVLVKSGGSSKKNMVLMVRVHDLKSTNGTMINGKVLPNGGSRQAFVKDRIQVGKSLFTILRC